MAGKPSKLRKRLVIFVWDTQVKAVIESKTISRAYSKLGFKKSINPSGISFNQQGSEVTVIAAKQQAFVTLDVHSDTWRNGYLPAGKAHAQAEGIAFVDGVIYIADEGVSSPATLTRYPDGF